MRNPYLALVPRFRPILLAGAMAGGVLPLPGAPPGGPPAKEAAPAAKEPAASAPGLIEAFMKGPISISAKVVRPQGEGVEATLPLFQVPVLEFGDKLELAFTGEAFDPRVTRADWSLVVVFLPRTVAPTEQGVVSFRLKRKDDRMTVPDIPVPYDSIPMLFLIPDKTGRRKVLKDLNAHLESFRTLCAKIADLSAERVELFRQQKNFLLTYGILDRDFDFDAWVDYRPLEDANKALHKLQAEERKEQKLAA